MATTKEAEAAVLEHGSKTAAARALGISRHAMNKLLAESDPVTDAQATEYIALNDVLAQYDTVGRVLNIVKEIPNGRVRTDDSIRSELGIGPDKWRKVRQSTRVSGYITQLPDKSWIWGTKQTIATVPSKLRELFT